MEDPNNPSDIGNNPGIKNEEQQKEKEYKKIQEDATKWGTLFKKYSSFYEALVSKMGTVDIGSSPVYLFVDLHVKNNEGEWDYAADEDAYKYCCVLQNLELDKYADLIVVENSVKDYLGMMKGGGKGELPLLDLHTNGLRRRNDLRRRYFTLGEIEKMEEDAKRQKEEEKLTPLAETHKNKQTSTKEPPPDTVLTSNIKNLTPLAETLKNNPPKPLAAEDPLHKNPSSNIIIPSLDLTTITKADNTKASTSTITPITEDNPSILGILTPITSDQPDTTPDINDTTLTIFFQLVNNDEKYGYQINPAFNNNIGYKISKYPCSKITGLSELLEGFDKTYTGRWDANSSNSIYNFDKTSAAINTANLNKIVNPPEWSYFDMSGIDSLMEHTHKGSVNKSIKPMNPVWKIITEYNILEEKHGDINEEPPKSSRSVTKSTENVKKTFTDSLFKILDINKNSTFLNGAYYTFFESYIKRNEYIRDPAKYKINNISIYKNICNYIIKTHFLNSDNPLDNSIYFGYLLFYLELFKSIFGILSRVGNFSRLKFVDTLLNNDIFHVLQNVENENFVNILASILLHTIHEICFYRFGTLQLTPKDEKSDYNIKYFKLFIEKYYKNKKNLNEIISDDATKSNNATNNYNHATEHAILSQTTYKNLIQCSEATISSMQPPYDKSILPNKLNKICQVGNIKDDNIKELNARLLNYYSYQEITTTSSSSYIYDTENTFLFPLIIYISNFENKLILSLGIKSKKQCAYFLGFIHKYSISPLEITKISKNMLDEINNKIKSKTEDKTKKPDSKKPSPAYSQVGPSTPRTTTPRRKTGGKRRPSRRTRRKRPIPLLPTS